MWGQDATRAKLLHNATVFMGICSKRRVGGSLFPRVLHANRLDAVAREKTIIAEVARETYAFQLGLIQCVG